MLITRAIDKLENAWAAFACRQRKELSCPIAEGYPMVSQSSQTISALPFHFQSSITCIKQTADRKADVAVQNNRLEEFRLKWGVLFSLL